MHWPASLELGPVVVDGADHRRARRAHGIGEENVAIADVAPDLGVVPRRPDHLALLVDLTAHEEVILTHEGRVEHLVHQLVDDLRRHRPGAGDPDRDGLGRAREGLPAVHGLGVRGDHSRGNVDPRAGNSAARTERAIIS